MDMKNDILKRFVADRFSMRDYLQVKDYMRKDENATEVDEFMQQDWNDTSLSADRKHTLGHILEVLHEQIKSTGETKKNVSYDFKRVFFKVAAVLILPALITIGVLSYLYIGEQKIDNSWVEIHSPVGARTNFQLPDGSIGWLNSGSSIKYQSQFNDSRKVEIEGEVWFDVTHQKDKDFVVHTPYFNVRVLGTKFNVTAYSEEEVAQVILEEGKVQVLDESNQLKSTLKPNERLMVNNVTHQFTKESFDAKSYVSWIYGKLIFKNVPFSAIAERIGRKYNVDVEIKDEELKTSIFRATFEDESLEEICQLLKGVAPVDYKIHRRKKSPDGTTIKGKVEFWLRK
ncbi:FecR family protein [Puteibacter caeruleilacunae]|nr:FecR family protein [Puteibacter caeruleilacunae]